MVEQISLGFEAVWEPCDVELWANWPLPAGGLRGNDKYTCPHVHEDIVPRVVVAYNEGGYNSVGICADCLLEALQKLEVTS